MVTDTGTGRYVADVCLRDGRLPSMTKDIKVLGGGGRLRYIHPLSSIMFYFILLFYLFTVHEIEVGILIFSLII